MALESQFARLFLLVAPLLLGGCAAVAIPVLAGGALAKDQLEGDGKPDPRPERIAIDYNAPPGTPMPGASPSPAPVATPGPPLAKVAEAADSAERVPPPANTLPPPAPKATAPAAKDEPPTSSPPVSQVKATKAAAAPVAAPVTLPEGPADAYAAFVAYALRIAPPPPPGTNRRSALIDQDTITDTPQLSECGNSPPAVVIDLDPGEASFDPADPPFPAPGLAASLNQLRLGGITVLWSASVPVERAQEVWTVLRASGLDPDRTDRLVLPRRKDERKQTRRLAAGREWCIVAIAGDRRSDFDELFDYLRDPSGPVAQALQPTFGNGWFLVPTPIE